MTRIISDYVKTGGDNAYLRSSIILEIPLISRAFTNMDRSSPMVVGKKDSMEKISSMI